MDFSKQEEAQTLAEWIVQLQSRIALLQLGRRIIWACHRDAIEKGDTVKRIKFFKDGYRINVELSQLFETLRVTSEEYEKAKILFQAGLANAC